MSEKKGFGRLDPEKLKEISSRGGKSAQSRPNVHRFTSETAREAAKRSRNSNKFNSETGKEAAIKSAKARKKEQEQ
jgi:hypothetical protein